MVAKRAAQPVAMGFQNVLEVLEEYHLPPTSKTQLWDYLNQATATIKPNYTRFQLTRWFDQVLTSQDTGEQYRADVLLLDFEMRASTDPKEEPYTGQCAFELYAGKRIKSLVICYETEES